MGERWKRRRKQSPEEKSPAHKPAARTRRDESTGRGPFYKAGAVVHFKEAGRGAVTVEGQEEQRPAGPVPNTRGSGVPEHEEAHATSVRLQGRTDADYDGGNYHTENERVQQAQGCGGCTSSNCIRVTGTLVATYRVSTTVTLPSVGDFPNLTACQRRRVQDAIDNVLAPHEQQHVRAFHQYDGTTRRPFDLTLCRSEFDSQIREMFEAEESQRRATAQAASDALDPFHFDVDLDCEEEQTATPDAGSGREATVAPPQT
jgi:hypothetical protein